VRQPTDRYLPPDHDAFVAAEPPTGRVIVIAPTRAACETIELAVGCTSRPISRSTTARACASWRAAAGLRHRRRHRHGEDAGHPPIAEEIVGAAARPLRVA
jgi:hypothetical protein